MIEFKNVARSYCGKIGCMCGCNGKYHVASHYGVEAANKDAGWKVHTRCGDQQVKNIINVLNELINWDSLDDLKKYVNEDFAWFDTDSKSYVVYFK